MRVSIDDSILNDIADSIREKIDTQDSFYPQDMSSAIDSFSGITPTGTINITSNGTTDVTNYEFASVSVLPSDYFTPTISAGSQNRSGLGDMIKTIPSNTVVNGTNLSNAFRNCKGLVSLPPEFDTSNVTNMQNMFVNTNIVTAPSIDTSSATDMSYMYNSCASLVNVPEHDTSSVTTMYQMFGGGVNLLSDESLNNILKMCINAVNYTRPKTLKEIGLTYILANRCTGLSNWADFTSAGWSTGY